MVQSPAIHHRIDHDLHFVVPAFLRMGELLERAGRTEEALSMVERCLQDYGDKKEGPDAPTEAQRAALKTRQSLLAAKVRK